MKFFVSEQRNIAGILLKSEAHRLTLMTHPVSLPLKGRGWGEVI